MYGPYPQQPPPRRSLAGRLRFRLRRARAGLPRSRAELRALLARGWAALERRSLAGEAATRRVWRPVRDGLVRASLAIEHAVGTGAPFLARRARPSVAWVGTRLGPRAVRPHHVGVAVAAVLLLDIAVWQTCGLRGCPDVRLLTSYTASGAAVLLDRHGEEVGHLRPVRREVVSLDDIPDHLIQAFVAVEDRRFYEHDGVDGIRIGGALVENLRRRQVAEGGSTITMQLARNLFSERLPARERTLRRKLLEARVAGEIERHFEKHEILELYLNHIYLGGGAYGVEAASRNYYGKPVGELTLAQSAMLAALPKAPAHYDPRRHAEDARRRRDLVLDRMEAQGRIDEEAAAAARDADLDVRDRPLRRDEEPYFAPWFAERVREEIDADVGELLYRRQLRVHTTLDAAAQRAAERELRLQLERVERGLAGRFQGPTHAAARASDSVGTGYLQGAMVVLDVRTGDVLAYVGGRDFYDSPYDRVAGGRRQLGSTFKPFVYAAAIADGVPTSTVMDDEPVRLVVDGTPWEPRNFDGRYRGRVTLREALVHSLNVPTVRLTQRVGVESVRAAARSVGFGAALPHSPVVALGAVDTNPMGLALAFTAFAGLGESITRPRFVLRVEDERGRVLWRAPAPVRERTLDPGAAYIVTDVLRDAVRRGTGTGALAGGFRGAVAGKTGTTNDGADAWFAGFTPDAVGVVWVGFDRRRPIATQATGGRIAAPVWGRVVPEVYASRPAAEGWRRPPSVVSRRIDPESGYVLADGCYPYWAEPRSELFLAGSVPAATCPMRESERRWRDAWDRFWGREPQQPEVRRPPGRGPRVLGVPADGGTRGRGRGRN
jgi:penicillin-binding protein 1A